MSDTTSTDKTLRVGGRKPLSLKRDTDTVRQSFSGGRSKAVVVEKKRTRVAGPAKRPDAPPIAETAAPPEPARPRVALKPREPEAQAQAQPQAPAPVTARPRTGGVVLRTLTDAERDAREHALQEARVREAEERHQAEAAA